MGVATDCPETSPVMMRRLLDDKHGTAKRLFTEIEWCADRRIPLAGCKSPSEEAEILKAEFSQISAEFSVQQVDLMCGFLNAPPGRQVFILERARDLVRRIEEWESRARKAIPYSLNLDVDPTGRR